ncbi:hypothetical protein ACN930_002157 [Vibrio parahaemolyticus]|uniref:hypothetical protein n=1 Tax=Vibrio harveyi group TaxID=717610 RepID=UPI00041F82C5|nr:MULTISPECIES: hypothetical protein [Vibrio harveyi group]EGR3414609.1 hypothetical protein [Vibrio parahaemolyticus]EJE1250995.1 hypothetical protein [Vibrio parahaemolyticus]EJE4185963.1 hypothetical protein [Vibrio parahaemolyticus]EJG1728572.1 hypothetical protein [Vibrio parahaemolyticus]EJG1865634.1 hypothetical protein [Vibrio parahaemolyticus]
MWIRRGESLTSFLVRKKNATGSLFTQHVRKAVFADRGWKNIPSIYMGDICEKDGGSSEAHVDLLAKHTALKAYAPTLPPDTVVKFIDSCLESYQEGLSMGLRGAPYSVFSRSRIFKFCFDCVYERAVNFGFIWIDIDWCLDGHYFCSKHQARLSLPICSNCGKSLENQFDTMLSYLNRCCRFCNFSLCNEQSFEKIKPLDFAKLPFTSEYRVFKKNYPYFSRSLTRKFVDEAVLKANGIHFDDRQSIKFTQLSIPKFLGGERLRNYFTNKTRSIPPDVFWLCVQSLFKDFESFNEYLEANTYTVKISSKELSGEVKNDFIINCLELKCDD